MGYFHFGYPTDFSNTMIPSKLTLTCFFIKDGHSIIQGGALEIKPNCWSSLNLHTNLVTMLF